MPNVNATGRRIAITGASGVGKSVLAEKLADALQLSWIPEVARRLCEEKGLSSPAEISDQHAFRQLVLQTQLQMENAASPGFVSDRGTIDCWVLWQRWQLCSAMTFDTEAYYEQCRAQSARYTHIIYLPPLFPPVEDSFRWTDPDYIKQLDRMTRLTLFDWSLWERTYTITTDGPDQRLAEVIQWLETASH